ncbi:MAG: phosphatidylglycerophosphate synthase [Candidatus Promineifilaceae bacterium]|jgi:phosphatidylglycerophosphate synthase
MLDSMTRVAKEMVLSPFARVLKPVHPNVVTLMSAVPGLLAAWFATQGLMGWAITMWAANRILDGLDGTMARDQASQSDFGGYLDILIDFVVYAIIPIGIVLGQPTQSNWMALATLLAVYYVNSASWIYLSSILEKRGSGMLNNGEMTSVTMPTGVVEGTETVIAYFLFLIFSNYAAVLFLIFAALILITIAQRLIWARKHL